MGIAARQKGAKLPGPYFSGDIHAAWGPLSSFVPNKKCCRCDSVAHLFTQVQISNALEGPRCAVLVPKATVHEFAGFLCGKFSDEENNLSVPKEKNVCEKVRV